MTSNNTRAVDVHALENLSFKAYWAIDQLTTHKQDRFSSAEIAKFLIERVGINTSRQTLKYFL